MDKNSKIAVIGLGYVGLPLAVHFGAKFHTTGLDLKEKSLKIVKDIKILQKKFQRRNSKIQNSFFLPLTRQ